MSTITKTALALLVALAVGLGFRYYDTARGAEWVVSPAQVAAAKTAGKPGVQTAPGTIAVLPIRSETADILPFEWTFAGLVAGGLVFVGLSRLGTRRV